MFGRLSTLAHGLRVLVEALLYGLQYMLELPFRVIRGFCVILGARGLPVGWGALLRWGVLCALFLPVGGPPFPDRQ
jgi:hypothetical protein